MMSKIDLAWRTLVSAVLLCLAVPFTHAAETAAPAPRKPNIILIVADDLGYGDLGCYGQTQIQTPNLDKLASEGLRFTDFYAGSTVCAPSRCALMTGLHTGHSRIRGNASVPLRPEDATVAELLNSAGYHTGLIGKWGLGDANTTGLPQKKGFEEFLGYLDQVHAHDYYPPFLWRFDPRAKFDGQETLYGNVAGAKGTYTPDLFTTAGLNYMRLYQPEAANHYHPFFLYLAYTIPHANNEEGQRSGNGMQVPNDAPYSSESWPQVEKNKAAMITRLDTYVGQLRDKLKQLKIENNTIIFFTSDNGPHKEGGVDPKFFHSSGPFRGIKRDLYEGGIRVPLIVYWPGKTKPGTVTDRPFAFWDFLPTAAQIAGTAAPEHLDGISMVPTLLGRAQTNQHDFFYWEFHERGFQQAVRMGNWKAVRPQVGDPLELYDLTADPAEKQNVSAQHPEVIAKIEDYLKSARTESPDWPIKKPAQQAGK